MPFLKCDRHSNKSIKDADIQWKVTNSSEHKPAAVTLNMPMSIHNIHQLFASLVIPLDRCLMLPSSPSLPVHFFQGCSSFPTWCGKESSAFRSLFRRNADKWQLLLHSMSLDYLTCSKRLSTPPTTAGGNKQLINSSKQGHTLLSHWYLS